MSAVRNFFLLHVFTALLPPKNGDGGDDNGEHVDRRDYYDILGLGANGNNNNNKKKKRKPWKTKRSIAFQEIRKAYKAKSLRLHPDKVAQRRGRRNGDDGETTEMNEEEMKAEYEKVQEAYACLSDPGNRRQYHQLGCSGGRYQFVVVRHGLYHPAAVYHNVQHSGCLDKTRLVFLMSAILAAFLVQPILIAAKVNQILRPPGGGDDGTLSAAPWTLVLVPLWIFQATVLLGSSAILAFFLCRRGRGDDSQDDSRLLMSLPVVLALLENAGWFVGNWFLALRWDSDPTLSDWSWHVVAVPYYCALAARMAGAAVTAREAARAQHAMVSPERMAQMVRDEREDAAANGRKKENKEKKGGRESTANDENDAEENDGDDEDDDDDDPDKILSRLEEEYHVVTVDEEAVESAMHLLSRQPGGPALDEDDVEFLRVSMSAEYRAAEDVIRQQSRAVLTMLLFGISFVAVVACRLQGQIPPTVSWWTIFVPIWVYLGWQIVRSLFVCCCASVASAPVIVVPHRATTSSDGDNSDDGRQARSSRDKQGGDDDGRTRNRDGVGSSVVFASPEGSMKEFNEQPEKGEEEEAVSSSKDPIASTLQQQPAAPKTNVNGNDGAPSTTAEAGVGSGGDDGNNDNAEVLHEPGAATTDASTVKDGPKKSDDDDEEEDEDEPHISIDEETFRAWQRVQEETEGNAMEQQAKAQCSCCWSSFQLMVICLIVGKLEQDYSSSSDPEDPGYSAFWVLFPIFIVMGILMCCCCCLVYGAGVSGLDDLVERAEHRREDDNDEEQQQEGMGSAAAASPAGPLKDHSEPDHQADTQGQQKEATKKVADEDGLGQGDKSPQAPSPVETQDVGEEDMNDLD